MIQKTILLVVLLSLSNFAQSLSDKLSSLNTQALTTISVTIGGQFPVNGSFPAFTTDRIDQFISRMYNDVLAKMLSGLTDPYAMRTVRKQIDNFSLRNVTLKRISGEIIKLDLQKFRLTGDFSYNPYLKNDDVIIFPSIDLERNFFTIHGAVNNPGKFHFVEGDSLSDAILLAGGINKAYENVNSVKIYRLSYDGKSISTVIATLSDKIALKIGDQIILEAKETERKFNKVLIVGEINFPGIYPVTKNQTKLGELIKTVGGMREMASLKHARLFRGSSITQSLEVLYGVKLEGKIESFEYWNTAFLLNLEESLMLRMSNVLVEDTTYFKIENTLRVLTEGSSVDFSLISDSTSEIYNLKLRDNDVIIIPPQRQLVYVFGQVSNPGYINFSEGKNYKYYLNQSGGLGQYAENEIMIIKGNTRNWISAEENTVIEDGDYIFVPKQRLRSFNSYVQEYSAYVSIIASIATVILLILQFGK
jgi:protein involved in polysaccharide export with SLBB domain